LLLLETLHVFRLKVYFNSTQCSSKNNDSIKTFIYKKNWTIDHDAHGDHDGHDGHGDHDGHDEKKESSSSQGASLYIIVIIIALVIAMVYICTEKAVSKLRHD
jgi:hypothetical protein